MSKSNTTIIWTLIFEWSVVSCESRNWHQKGTCFKGIGLHVQTMLIILGLIVSMIGRLVWPLNEHDNVHFDKE